MRATWQKEDAGSLSLKGSREPRDVLRVNKGAVLRDFFEAQALAFKKNQARFPPAWFSDQADEKTMAYCKQLWSEWDFRDQVHWWESRLQVRSFLSNGSLQMGKSLTWDACD